jgi:hypothetical protein
MSPKHLAMVPYTGGPPRRAKLVFDSAMPPGSSPLEESARAVKNG